MSKYQYQTDDGEIIDVDFATAVESGAFLKLEDGRLAKRINRPSVKKTDRGPKLAVLAPIVSDAMGFTDNQLAEMRADAEANPQAHRGIEFVQDPTEPRFYQVHCASEEAKRRYMKHRRFSDRNSRNGGGRILSPEQLENAKALILRQHAEGEETEQS